MRGGARCRATACTTLSDLGSRLIAGARRERAPRLHLPSARSPGPDRKQVTRVADNEPRSAPDELELDPRDGAYLFVREWRGLSPSLSPNLDDAELSLKLTRTTAFLLPSDAPQELLEHFCFSDSAPWPLLASESHREQEEWDEECRACWATDRHPPSRPKQSCPEMLLRAWDLLGWLSCEPGPWVGPYAKQVFLHLPEAEAQDLCDALNEYHDGGDPSRRFGFLAASVLTPAKLLQAQRSVEDWKGSRLTDDAERLRTMLPGAARRTGGNAPDSMLPTASERTAPPGFLSASDLATRLGVDPESLRKRLERRREKSPGGQWFKEVANPTSRTPTYLYEEGYAETVADGMLRGPSGKASGKRPAT